MGKKDPGKLEIAKRQNGSGTVYFGLAHQASQATSIPVAF
jgi:hypothetical protein